LRRSSTPIIDAAHAATLDVLSDFSATSADFATVQQHRTAFRRSIRRGYGVNELAYMHYVDVLSL
jgi:TRAP-type mannitol/chloroaromatic compound transport system substrate-binding protein